MEKISVIIPAFNEEENIANTIKTAKKCELVDEVLVIDNLSTDKTVEIAKQSGARVEKCNIQGKGYAMKEGIKQARNSVVVFLDADVKYINESVVCDLAKPILNGETDFVKSTFDRKSGGMVTEVAIKPLLDILYPDMYKFSEPISGMIASKREILIDFDFDHDYGVDIGILIDVISKGYKVTEVNIGEIENMSHVNKNPQTMRKMSYEVMKSILQRKN